MSIPIHETTIHQDPLEFPPLYLWKFGNRNSPVLALTFEDLRPWNFHFFFPDYK